MYMSPLKWNIRGSYLIYELVPLQTCVNGDVFVCIYIYTSTPFIKMYNVKLVCSDILEYECT